MTPLSKEGTNLGLFWVKNFPEEDSASFALAVDSKSEGRDTDIMAVRPLGSLVRVWAIPADESASLFGFGVMVLICNECDML